jgi:hypothetical protein
MGNKIFVVLAALIVLAIVPGAGAQSAGILLEIEKHAVLTRAGLVIIRIHITCGPFAGIQEFQEGHAGGGQSKTGASSETGIDGTVLCDGVERIHTAHLSPLDEAAFKHGPASASASLFLCTLAGEEQMCFSGSTSRRVIIRGGPPSS